jgi:hypothetical protein
MKDTIFVQIASYRDPELIPTIDDLLTNADKPENVHVCIAWQHAPEDEWDNLDKYRNDERITILDIPYKDSLGACWARNKIQQEYKDEKYTLQLDSHHRFSPGWDTKCIKMIESLQEKGHKKPLLTSYIPSYQPNNDPEGRVNVPWGMSFDRFIPEGPVFFLPYHMNNQLNPLPARFFSAHFCFTLGQFSKEVQHDPEYYFHGEEITLAVRAYTHGYDLFHPNEVIAFHEYTRVGRTKQWDDDPYWTKKNTDCHRKVRSLLGVDDENEIQELEYGLGTERTLEDYEKYAGIKFSTRSITENCKANKTPGKESDDPIYFQEFRHAIDIPVHEFTEPDYTFCAVVFEDVGGKEINRQDIPGEEFNAHLDIHRKNNSQYVLWRSYQGPKPNHIVLWPHSNSKGWMNKKVLSL